MTSLKTPTARRKLTPRHAPYFETITTGLQLGYRRTSAARAGKWVVKRAGALTTLGSADDLVRADGETILTHAQALQAAQEGTRPAVEGSVHGAVDAWLQERLRGLTVAKSRNTTASMARRVQETFTDRAISAVSAKAVRDWHTTLTDEIGATSADRYLSALKASLNRAVGTDYQGPRPWAGVKKNGEALAESAEPRPITREEQDALLDAADPDFRRFLLVSLWTGARTGEVAQLRVGDFVVTDAGASLRIRAATSKVRRARTVDLGPQASQRLQAWTAGRDADETLLTDAAGRDYASGRHDRPFRRAREAAGLDASITPYTTRDTAITRMLSAGAPAAMVAQRHGTSVRMIEKHYARFTASDMAKYLMAAE